MSYFRNVGDFHERMKLPLSAEWCCLKHGGVRAPAVPVDKEWDFRLAFFVEEFTELLKAQAKGDLPAFSDALVDLVYVLLGTAHYAGLPFDALWKEVHGTNMAKRPWQEGDPVKPRNTTGLEVTKPEGWHPPDIAGVIKQFRVEVQCSLEAEGPVPPYETTDEYAETRP